MLGLPDAVYGERVAAVMVLRSGATGDGSLAAPPGGNNSGSLPAELTQSAAEAQAAGKGESLREFALKVRAEEGGRGCVAARWRW